MAKHNHTLHTILLLAVACAGCAAAKTSLPAFHYTLSRGAYQAAKNLADGEIGPRNTHQDLLWNLQAGALERLLRNYTSSNAYFDWAEDAFRYFDLQSAAGKSVQGSKGILFNDSALPYTGKMYDRVMVNTYKALNYAILGDTQSARVEFNRVLQRQNDAKTLFAAQAEELKKRLSAARETPGPSGETVQATLNNPELERVLNERYKNLNEFKLFTDFINPFATYIAGLYFWLEGDTPKAVDILKEAYAIGRDNPIMASDFARASRGEAPSGELWVVFENGLAPRREEMRVDIPVLLRGEGVNYIGTAFPNLVPGEQAYSTLSVSDSSGAAVDTQPLASMENVIASEFNKELPGIRAREITRVALKTYFQYRMQKNYGIVAGVASGLYQAATTAVDIRSWTALPRDFQLAHTPIPPDRLVTITPAGGAGMTINIPTGCRNVIVYVRVVAPGLDPVYDLIKF